MIIICDNCGTRYQINEEDIGEAGRKVRCTRCSHVWLQSPFVSDTEEDILSAHIHKRFINFTGSDTDTTNNDNSIISVQCLKLSCVVLLLMIGISLFAVPRGEITPFLRPMYSVFNIYDSSGLEFDSASLEHYKINDKEGTVIMATIINNSKETKRFPDIRISLQDDNSDIIRVINLNNKFEKIAPNETKDIIRQISNLPENVQLITLDIGNKLELLFQ